MDDVVSGVTVTEEINDKNSSPMTSPRTAGKDITVVEVGAHGTTVQAEVRRIRVYSR